MIRYLDAFADYNPLEDRLSEKLLWEVGYIEQEAKWLLPDDYTLTDLNAGLEILFQLKKYSPVLMLNYRKQALEDTAQTSMLYSPPMEYFTCLDEVEIGTRPNGAPYPWSCLFAVLALASISDYVAIANKTVYEYEPNDHPFIATDNNAFNSNSYYQNGLITEAMEALGYARLLAEREKNKNTYKKRGKTISKKKLDHYHDLKLAIVTHLNQLPSDIRDLKAAKLIYENLDESLKNKSLSEDPIKQTQIWIGQYKRGVLPGQDKLPPYLDPDLKA